MEKLKQKLLDLKIITKKGCGYRYVKKILNNTDIHKSILKATTFLDQDQIDLKERLFYIRTLTTSPVLCKTCNINKVNIDFYKMQYSKYCSLKCSTTCLEVKEKTKQTNLKKYGTEYGLQNEDILNKVKQTNLERYGVKNTFQNKKIKEKIEQTHIKRYGVKNPFQNKKIKEKIEQTNIKRYGVKRPTQCESIKNKVKYTNLTRHGVENPMLLDKFKNKVKQTNISKYDRDNYNQKHIPLDILELLNCPEWLILQHHIKHKSLNQIAIETCLSNSTSIARYMRKHKIPIYRFNYSYACISWLNHIMKKEHIYIQHSCNKGEYRIPNTPYYADGYCKETNTIYEFHGDYFHGNPAIYEASDKPRKNYEDTFGELYEKTIVRENKIKSLGYSLVTIWESEWSFLIKN